MISLTIISLGYTLPPLRLSYRTLGEIDVGLTHSIGVMLCGFLFQGGPFDHPFPWMISIPLFLSIVPAIILAGIPDYAADLRSEEHTSELQSRGHLVCRLLLEKKNKTY